MTAADDARVLRAAAEVWGRVGALPHVGALLAEKADLLDPPAPLVRLYVETREPEKYRLTDGSATYAGTAEGTWALVTATPPAEPVGPRVLPADAPCPPTGSVWRDGDGDEFTVVDFDKVRWSKPGCTYDTNWINSAFINFPVTEVFP